MEQKEIAKKMLPIIKEIAYGKTIQFYNGKEWVTETGVNLKEICNDIIEGLAEYRIKPDDEFQPENKLTETQKQYKPFKDCDEMIKYWYDFSGVINCSPRLFMPKIWVRHKRYGTNSLITAFDNNNESIDGSCVFVQDLWLTLQELFDNFTFLDGSPCGCRR